MKLSISYKLVGSGWAECDIFVDGKTVTITASYLGDAFGEITRATLEIAKGAKLQYAIFPEEPGEFRWKLVRKRGKDLEVEILWFEEWNFFRKEDEKGKRILEFECSIEQFVRRIVICLSEVLNNYGVEGYKEMWVEHGFPMKDYEELRKVLTEIK